jgi:predicted solute-binding protein
MFHAEIINDVDKLNEEESKYKEIEIPVISNVTQQQVLDNYYQVKMEVKRLIGEDVERLKAAQN